MKKEKLKCYEIEYRGTEWYKGEYERFYYLPENNLDMMAIYERFLNLERFHREKLELTIKEIEVEYIHQFDNELFTKYSFYESGKTVIYDSYINLEDLLRRKGFEYGRILRESYHLAEDGKKLETTYIDKLDEFEEKCVENKIVLSETKYIINEMNELEQVSEQKLQR